MSADLLPCPFCGGPADVLSEPPSFTVECRWCDSRIGKVGDKEFVIDKWNRRAASAPPTGQAEALENAGTLLSNWAFNMAQRCAHTLTSDDCAELDKMRKRWDAAYRATPASGEGERND